MPLIEPTALLADSLPTAVVSLKVIEALANAPHGLGVTQLSHLLGMPKARAHRHLSALRDHGYVSQDANTNLYRVGWRLYLLGRACINRFDVTTMAKPVLQRLRDAVGQTVVIATYANDTVVVVDVLRGTSPLEIALRPGTSFAHNASAQGKIVLAYGSIALREAFLAAPLPRATPRSIVDPGVLRSELDRVRRQGWADAPEQLFAGINALAAPILQADNTLFGTLAIVGSIHYLPETPDPAHILALLQAASEISTLMGHVAASPAPAR